MNYDRILRGLLVFGAVLSGILLVRFALDLNRGLTKSAGFLLAIPFWALVAASLAAAAMNIAVAFRSGARFPTTGKCRVLALASIPAAFIASSLDCTGLSLQGCSSFCTFVKVAWIPLMALVCAAYSLAERRWMLVMMAAMSLVPIWPHCPCYNVANAWWIDSVGRSPECYAWGLMASVISISALSWGRIPESRWSCHT